MDSESAYLVLDIYVLTPNGNIFVVKCNSLFQEWYNIKKRIFVKWVHAFSLKINRKKTPKCWTQSNFIILIQVKK